MAMTRREFLNVLAAAAASGLPLSSRAALSGTRINGFYDLANFGANVTLLHFTDCHAQLLPVYYREPSINIGVGEGVGKPPHLVGEAVLKHYAVSPGSKQAYALTHLNFQDAARRYGKVGGFAHLATLVKKVRDQRPGALLLDGGDTWQGSATSLWTKGQDMIDACKLLGVDVMTGHWEFTYGAERVKEVVEKDFKDRIEFVAQNVKTTDFGDAVFKPYVMREMNGIPIAIVGQAFPYTPIANPRYFVPDWTFGIQEENLQKVVNEARDKGAQVVVVLSHNGIDVDLKLANRVSGITAILGGHTHDAVPQPVMVKNHNGYTVVTNAGCNGKFLGVLDLRVEKGRVGGYQYKLLPVFSNLLPPDHEMSEHVKRVRAPYESRLNEKLATAGELLYRRGNFNGTFDQVILDALTEVKNAEIAFSPGFRWGTTLLPGDPITMERLMDQTAITYPYTTVSELTGERIREILEAVCDNLFHPDPYLQQGGDMVRVGGMTYTCDPTQTLGSRISDMRVRGKPMQADKTYKVAGWAPVGEGASGEPIWDVVAKYLRHKKTVSAKPLNVPKLVGVEGNPGVG